MSYKSFFPCHVPSKLIGIFHDKGTKDSVDERCQRHFIDVAHLQRVMNFKVDVAHLPIIHLHPIVILLTAFDESSP